MKKKVPILLDTIDAFYKDDYVINYFIFIEKMIEDGYVIELYMVGDKEPTQIFETIEHIKNFNKRHSQSIGVKY